MHAVVILQSSLSCIDIPPLSLSAPVQVHSPVPRALTRVPPCRSRRSFTPYIVWGATAAEVELDVLTGEFCVRRVDLYEDAGQSISPWVDVGQAEGAFVMGMGLFLTERHRFHPVTGRRLTNRTWVSGYRPSRLRVLTF